MENDDEQKHNVNEASTSIDCDTNVHETAQNEMQNRYVIAADNKKKKKTSIIKIAL